LLYAVYYAYLNNNVVKHMQANSNKVKAYKIVYKHNNVFETVVTKPCTYEQALQAFKELNTFGTLTLARIY
jgi:fibronectin type 3 domain-containing protein